MGLVMAPSLAMALTAITTGWTNLRAGPASNFPVVDRIPADARVNVHGCVRAYRWCDVSWRDARGWLPGGELAYLHNGRRETIVEYGPRIGVPVVGFSIAEVELGMVTAPVGVPRGESVTTITVAAPRASD